MSVREMQAGREMDALVAERVMGWTNMAVGELGAFGHPPAMAPEWAATVVPHYSTDIAAVWLVVEHMKQNAPVRFKNLILVAYSYRRTYASFDAHDLTWHDGPNMCEANGEHATPLAICRAAMAALGVA